MARHLLITCFFWMFIFQGFLCAQSINRHRGEANGKAFTYFVMKPKFEVNGILLLLHGSGEKAKKVFDKTSLPRMMVDKGFLVVAPELNNALFADQKSINELDEILQLISQQYTISNLFIGGFSSGGAVAIGYAEYLISTNSENILKGVFAIDPPLDLERLYTSAERKINYTCEGPIQNEGQSIKQQLENSFGGPPESKSNQYVRFSSYSTNDPNGGNAKHLKNIPIRLYTEPDLDFVRKTYCSDLQFEDINAVDLEGLYEFLVEIGNDKVEYITTTGRGFHSWNIVDASDCAEWMVRIVNE